MGLVNENLIWNQKQTFVLAHNGGGNVAREQSQSTSQSQSHRGRTCILHSYSVIRTELAATESESMKKKEFISFKHALMMSWLSASNFCCLNVGGFFSPLLFSFSFSLLPAFIAGHMGYPKQSEIIQLLQVKSKNANAVKTEKLWQPYNKEIRIQFQDKWKT